MKRNIFIYSIAASIILHVIALGAGSHINLSRSSEVHDFEPVEVQAFEPERKIPVSHPIQPVIKTPLENFKKSENINKDMPPTQNIPTSKAVTTSSGSNRPNPGGALNIGSTSSGGDINAASGNTPVGWVPGSDSGKGQGSGDAPGKGTPEPPRHIEQKPAVEMKAAPPPPAPRANNPEPKPEVKHESIITKALLMSRTEPRYPRSARDNGIEGSVKVKYTINTDGNVSNIEIVRSSGNRELDNAAVSAVEKWRYHPGTVDGEPKSSQSGATIVFQLQDEE